MTQRDKYSADELERLGRQGHAFKNLDGSYSYPVANEEDLKNAILAVGRGDSSHDAIRKFVMRRATELGLRHLIPADWSADGALMQAGGSTDGRSGHLTDSLVRAWGGGEALSLRDAEGNVASDGNTLVGHFAVWNRWTEINSPMEGHFMERLAPGAFDASLASRAPKVLFNHGKDPSIGNKPLGVPTKVEGDTNGMRYEVPLFDTAYNAELKPGLAAGVYGASFRFGVPDGGAEWNDTPTRSASNPDGLPECTLVRCNLYEFGPVTFGQYADATAGMRSMTDDFVERMLDDPVFLARLVERAGAKNVIPLLNAARSAAEEEEGTTPDSGGAAAETIDLSERRKWLARLYD